MAIIINSDGVRKRVEILTQKHAARVSRQKDIIALTRGVDPRTVNDATQEWERLRALEDSNIPLRTNDPTSYLDLSNHLLSGQPIEWGLPRYSRISEDVELSYGKAERLIASFFHMNNVRLVKKGKSRFERALTDAANRLGMVCVYKRAVTVNGALTIIMEPWSPLTVSERTDDYGVAEIARSFKAHPMDLLLLSEQEPTGWDVEVIGNWLRDDVEEVNLVEYYTRHFDGAGNGIVQHSVIVSDGGNNNRDSAYSGAQIVGTQAGSVKELSEVEFDTIPVEIRHFNGEAFPHNADWRQSQSILESNYNIYLLHNDNLKRIEDHRDRQLALKVQENTLGGSPGPADAGDLARNDEIGVFTYRVGEGFNYVNTPGFDPSLSILEQQWPGMIQRGGVPYVLHGGVDVNLSGFAIFQLLNAALASVGETKVVLEDLYSSLGKWVLDTFKSSASNSIEGVGFNASANNGEFFHEPTLTAGDMPDFTDVRAKINLSQPSDLIERVNIARTANPGGQSLFTTKTMYEELFTDIVHDAAGESLAVEEQNILQLPVMQMLRARARLVELQQQSVAAGNQYDAEAIGAQIQLIEQSIAGTTGGTAPQQNQQQGNPNPDQRVMSTEMRQPNGIGPSANGAVPQEGAV